MSFTETQINLQKILKLPHYRTNIFLVNIQTIDQIVKFDIFLPIGYFQINELTQITLMGSNYTERQLTKGQC